MNVSNIKYFSTVNGDGIRTAVFVSGCRIHCKGCFNKEAWDFNFGKELTDDLVEKILESTSHDYIDGLTILGGEPMDPDNQGGVLSLITKYRERYGKTKTIWLYTGYNLESIPKTEYTDSILSSVDVVVDGPFIITKRNPELAFRGSDNQRIIKSDNIHVIANFSCSSKKT